MEHTNNTHEAPGTLHGESIALQDAHERVQDLVGWLVAYVDEANISPRVLVNWVAGKKHLDRHAIDAPENRGPQRLAYLWLLDALVASPDAVSEAMRAVRADLVKCDPALQPYAEKAA